MLIAHLVPGYFAAAASEASWSSGWSRGQRAVLWAAALGSTVTPDLDVVYNVLFRRFFNHSTLWTHSLWVYLGLGLVWLSLRLAKRWAYPATLIGLVTLGGLSHLVLDMVAHGTPIFYPVSMVAFGIAPQRVIVGGLWAYLTDPIFILEPLLFGIALVHWAYHRNIPSRVRKGIVGAVLGGFFLLSVAFLVTLPTLQRVVQP